MSADIEKILIIDDNEDYSSFLKMLLENEGYAAFTSKEASDAFNIAHEILPDCIVLDYFMPYSSGVEIAEKMKSDNVLKNVPIIFLTTNDSKDAFMRSVERGADDYVVKSNDFDFIYTRIKAMLRLKKLQDANTLYTVMLQHDLRCAGSIQSAILEHSTQIPQTDFVEVYKPYGDVSGDYYDVKMLSETKYAILLADVAGHGVAASMLTLFIKSYFENNSLDKDGHIPNPNEFIEGLNTLFVNEGFESSFYTTIFYGIYDYKSGELFFSKGGHPAPFLYRAESKSVERLNAKGMLVGVSEGMRYELKKVSLKRNDTLMLFTDGVFEVFGKKGEIYGEERLMRVFKKEKDANTPVEKIPEKITKAVARYSENKELDDDVTMLFLQRP